MATRRSRATGRTSERAAPGAAKTRPRVTGRARPARSESPATAPGAVSPTHPERPRSRSRRPLAHLPPVAPCAGLDTLRSLDPAAARAHVDMYLHSVMSPAAADDFEAGSYRWELHLVALDQLCLLRAVELSRGKLRRYRAAFRRGEDCAPLIGLGGEGRDPTRAVLVCDGYHRAVALRDAGLHFAWVWLAMGPWRGHTPA